MTIWLSKRVLLPRQKFEPGCCRPELRQQGGIQIRIPEHLNVTRCRLNDPQCEAGRKKRESEGRGKRHLPGESLLDLEERGRALLQCDDDPVAVTSPNGFAAFPAEAHCRDRGPGFDP